MCWGEGHRIGDGYSIDKTVAGYGHMLAALDATLLQDMAQDNRRQLGVMVSWRENEKDSTSAYKNDIDATKVRANDGVTLTDGADATNACPTGRTCHLQYLPVAARCAPYLADATVQYFCPGT